MKVRGHIFPILMCFLTVATAAMYGFSAISGREYNFVVRTDEAGIHRIRAGLEGADIREIKAGEVEEGIYQITLRCPRDKVGAMLRILGSFSELRTKK